MGPTMRLRGFAPLLAGLALWALVFAALYALHGVGCARGWALPMWGGWSLHRVVLLGVWLGGLAAGVALAWALARPPVGAAAVGASAAVDAVPASDGLEGPQAWLLGVGRWLAWAGVAATAITGAPIALLPDCL